MQQWLIDHAGWISFSAVVLIIALHKPILWLVKHVFNISKTVHEVDQRLIGGYAQERELINAALDRAQTAKEEAIRRAARQQVTILDLLERLQLKEDVNQRDRIARIIYLRHLRVCGDDTEAIEREIKEEVERRIIHDGFN